MNNEHKEFLSLVASVYPQATSQVAAKYYFVKNEQLEKERAEQNKVEDELYEQEKAEAEAQCKPVPFRGYSLFTPFSLEDAKAYVLAYTPDAIFQSAIVLAQALWASVSVMRIYKNPDTKLEIWDEDHNLVPAPVEGEGKVVSINSGK